MANPNTKPRDPILQDSPGTAGGSVKRGDLLNGSPRTKSLSEGGANFTGKADPKGSWPVPDSPYGKG
jgi:hypothetical protein